MRALTASSKLKGKRETGFAFGMGGPPSAIGVAHSSPHISSENAVPVAFSASCYHIIEDVGILAVIVPVRKLGQIQRQISLAHIVERAHDAPLEQTPEAIQVRGMDIPAHVFPRDMVDGFMLWKSTPSKVSIAARFIGGDKGDSIGHSLLDELGQRLGAHVLHDLGHDVAFSSNGSNDGHLALRTGHILVSVPHVTILLLAADERFIDFDFAHEFVEAAALHRRSDAMAHIPGRAVVAASDLAMDLQGTHALLALQHQVNNLEPGPKRIVGILENRFGNDGEPVAVWSAAVLRLADPVKRTALQLVYFVRVAARAFHAIRPAKILQVFFAGVLSRKLLHQLSQRDRRLGRQFLFHGSLRVWREYRQDWESVSSAT